MLYQNDLKPLVITTTSQAFAIYASVKADAKKLGDLLAFPLVNKCIFYYDSLLRRLKIQEDLPDFETPIRKTTPNVTITTEVDGQTISDTLTAGTTFPASNRLTNNQKRSSIDAPFQVVYFTKEAISERLYGSVNGGSYIDLGSIKILDVATKGGFITINYHKFYEQLNAKDYDVLNFKFANFRETIQLNAIYSDFPFVLVMRNQYGFFDTFRLFGNQENNLDFQSNTIETNTELRTIYSESIEKISVQTGLLEQNEKRIIGQNLQNLDLFEYRNGSCLRLINELKNINLFSAKEAQDSLKLEFRYATTNRKYL